MCPEEKTGPAIVRDRTARICYNKSDIHGGKCDRDYTKVMTNIGETRMGYDDSIVTICRQFTDEPVTETEAVFEGHINDTCFVKTGAGRYVLQRLQPRMDASKLLYNYGLYAKACDSAGWEYPKWMQCKDGTYFFTDSSGFRWRMYPYIDAETLQAPLTREQLFACGKGLSKLHGILQTLPAEPKPVYPMLHDLSEYYERYLATLSGDNLCEESRVPEAEEQIHVGIERFLTADSKTDSAEAGNIRIIHGDAKLSNILFRNGEAVGMLDWDTVMAGSASEELADCIRSCCVSRGDFDREAADIIVQGYQSGMKEAVVSDLPRAFDKINFELALRYYTDVISKEKTFKERYPGYRLTRVRELLGVTWR